MAKDTGKKLIDMMYGQNPDQAAFGVYPQLKPKRTAQDHQAAKNVPVDLLRGAVSGVLGAPGDIESLIRLLPGLDEKTILPTSEDIEKRLPFKSDTPVSRAATGVGQIGGGFYTGPGSPLRLVGALPSAVKRAGQDFAMAAAESGPKIFIGPKAKTWNQAKADAAIRMEKEGVDPGVIWQQTGTFRGADGILRQEIDDRAAKFLMPDERQERVDAVKQKIAEMQEQIKRTPQKDLFPKALTEAKKEVRDDIDILKGEVRGRTKNPRTQGLQAQFIFEHPELYKAYPELQNVNVVTEGSGGAGTRGALSIIPSRGQIPGKMEMDVYDRGLIDNPTSTTLHEMQHAVQTLEGMGPGGNPTFAFSDPRASEMLQQERLKMLKALPYEDFVRQGGYTDMEQAGKDYAKYTKGLEGGIDPAYDRMLQERVAMEYYKRLLGEAEARAVQDRQLMTPSQRMETPPAASYDVPQEDLIVKPPREFAEGGQVVISEDPDIMQMELAGGGGVHFEDGGAAFGRYTTGKKYQAAKKRAENADVNLLPDPKTYAVVQGLLGTAPDEMGFSVLHPKYQEIKEVADPAFAVGTALQVMPAAKPGALALARKGERLAERVVPGIMERGGLPADILSGLAQGSQSYAKAAKEAAVPLDIPRVRPTKQAIMEAAERVGRQQLGEHVTNPLTGKTVNLAGRSKKEAQRLKEVQYEVEPIKDLPKMGPYEAKVGEVNIALPGDQSISDMVLKSVEGVPIGSTQEGGALFGRGRLQDPEAIRAFWASNLVPAQNFQNKVDEIARMFNTDQVTAYHLAMGQTANNFAQHLADANLRAIDYSKLNKNKMDIFDSHIAAGFSVKDKKTGKYVHTTFPDWPGIANPEAALQAMKENPELRKWFNNRMKTEELTKGTDMPYGKAIEWAATEPELRNMEINLTGLSAGRMKPGAKLIPESAHQTYSHDIPGTALGHAPELAPFSISFPDVTDFVSKNYRPQDFTGTIQKVFPHQIVDEAYLEDMNKYYEQLRRVRGFADGGEVHGLSSQDMLYLQSQPDIGKLSPQEQREYVTNIKPDELRQRMQGKYAGGGEITADDLILEERKL